jgi:hypothetical protein
LITRFEFELVTKQSYFDFLKEHNFFKNQDKKKPDSKESNCKDYRYDCPDLWASLLALLNNL